MDAGWRRRDADRLTVRQYPLSARNSRQSRRESSARAMNPLRPLRTKFAVILVFASAAGPKIRCRRLLKIPVYPAVIRL